LFAENCSVCHGAFGEGGPNPALSGDIILPISTAEYLKTRDDTTLRNIISFGQPNSGMSPFGDANGGPLNDEQLDAIVAFIRSWEANPPVDELPKYPEVGSGAVSSGGSGFSGQILPIFESRCAACHNANRSLGGWDATSYDAVMSSGENAPVIIPGDVENSLLAQYLLGTNGDFMPPIGSMPENEIQSILDWIAAGAENK